VEGGEEVGRPLGLTIPTHVPLHLYAITWKCLPTSHLIDRELSTQVRAWANENPLLGEVKALPGIKDVEVTAPRLGYVFPELFNSDLHFKSHAPSDQALIREQKLHRVGPNRGPNSGL
jgi:hypothetical protein